MTGGFELVPLIKSLGYIGIFSAIILENGVPLFFWLPGDTLLLTAGFLAAQGFLDIKILVIGGFIMAVLGYMVGYFLGFKLGLRMFKNGDTKYVKMEHLEKTKEFYQKYGNWSLLIARFLPLRSFVCFLAGVTEMPYWKFMIYNVIGAVAWGVFLPLIGYFVGEQVGDIQDLEMLVLLPLLGVVGTVLLIPMFLHGMKKKPKKEEE